MQTILQGDLRRFPAGELLTMLRSHDGALAVVSNEKRVRILFRSGSIAAAESDDPMYELSSMLTAYGLLTKEQLEVLERGGELDASDRHLAFQASEIIFDVFSWSDGRFGFTDESDIEHPLSLNIDALIDEGTRRAAEVQKVLELYPDNQVVFRVVEDPGPQAKISLSAEEFRLLFRIGSGRSLKQICEDAVALPVRIYPIVHGLESNGLISRVSADTPAPAPPPPPVSAVTRPQPTFGSETEFHPEPLAQPEAPPFEPPPPPPPVSSSAPGVSESPGAFGAPADTPPPAASWPPELVRPAAPARTPDPTMIQSSGFTAPGATLVPPQEPVPSTMGGTRLRAVMGSLSLEGTNTVFQLADSELTIGREPGNQIILPDGSVSSRHAQIQRNAGGFLIEDLQSRNGTFVNGERVASPVPLADKDLIRIGKVLLTFHMAADLRDAEVTKPDIIIS